MPKHKKATPKPAVKTKQQQTSKKPGLGDLFELYFLPVTLILLIPLVSSKELMDFNAAPRLFVLSIVVLLVAVFNLLKQKKQTCSFRFVKLGVFPVIILYIVWSLISLIPAMNPGAGAFDVVKSTLTAGLLIYFVDYIKTQKNSLNVLVKSIIISTIVATNIGVYQYINNVPGKSGEALYMALYEVKGLMAHKNQFAISLLLMLPFVIYGVVVLKRWWKGVAAYSLLMILIDITIVQTRSVWVAVIFFALSVLILIPLFYLNKNLKGFLIKNKKAIGITAGAIVIFSVVTLIFVQQSGSFSLLKEQASSTFSTKSANAQHRIKMWNASLQLFEDNPWLGVGAGNWKIAVIPYYHLNFGSKYQNWLRPHNDYIWVLTEKGIVGLLLFLTIFGFIVYYGFKILFSEKDKNRLLLTILMLSGIIGYMFASFFTFPLERINHQIYLALMMAVIIALYGKPDGAVGKTTLYRVINILVLIISLFAVYYAYTYVKSEYYVRKLYIANETGNQKKVIKYCDKAYSVFTNTDYNNVPIKMFRGLAQMKLNNLNQAYSDLKWAYNNFPYQTAVLNNLGIVAAQLGKKEEALSYFRQSLFLFPHYEKTLANLVIAYYQQKQYDKAYLALLNQDTRKPNKQYKDFKKGLEKLINTRKSRDTKRQQSQ